MGAFWWLDWALLVAADVAFIVLIFRSSSLLYSLTRSSNLSSIPVNVDMRSSGCESSVAWSMR